MKSIQLLAHSLAARVPAMQQDCTVNNAYMIEQEIKDAVAKELEARDILLREALLALEAMSPALRRNASWVNARAEVLIAKLEKALWHQG